MGYRARFVRETAAALLARSKSDGRAEEASMLPLTPPEAPKSSNVLPPTASMPLSLPSVGRSLPFVGSSLPPVGSSLPSVGSSLPSVVSSLPSVGSSLPSVGSSLHFVGSSLPFVGSSLPSVVHDTYGSACLSACHSACLGRQWLLELRDHSKFSRKEVQQALMEFTGVGQKVNEEQFPLSMKRCFPHCFGSQNRILCVSLEKVADCVALFSLDQSEIIPVDTHVWRIACRDLDPTLLEAKLAC